MSELDPHNRAWRETPNAYLARRPGSTACPSGRSPSISRCATAAGSRSTCTCRRTRRATTSTGRRSPTILFLTPYYRRFAVGPTDRAVEASPGAGRYRDLLVPRGYALVVVDVRGTGASFGTRDSFRSPVEREDDREIADWIVRAAVVRRRRSGRRASPMSGRRPPFSRATGHPAVKAIAPLFAVWDTWGDHYYPGGVLMNQLARSYDELMVALDHDRRDLLGQFAYFRDPAFAGPQPVDDDADGTLCRAAVAEHRGNFRMPDFITEFRFRDDRLPYDPSFGAHSFSPYGYAESIREDLAIYSISGWMDGAGFANGAIVRFLSLPGRHRHLLLGPWDHGARANVSPWREGVEPRFSVLAEVLRFFDEYLQARDTGLRQEAPVHYFTMHGEEWRGAAGWPPVAETRSLFLGRRRPSRGGSRHRRAASPPGRLHARHRHPHAARAPRRRRHARLLRGLEWPRRAHAPLRLGPAGARVEMSGHPVVTLWVASSEGDAAVFVYLSEVEADGRVSLRHRGRAAGPPPPGGARADVRAPDLARIEPSAAPTRADAHGRAAAAALRPAPDVVAVPAGSRIRLAIAGADADHYVQDAPRKAAGPDRPPRAGPPVRDRSPLAGRMDAGPSHCSHPFQG